MALLSFNITAQEYYTIADVTFAVYNRTSEETEIVAQAQLIINGKPKKKVTARGTAKSISTATLIIDEGGKFSQADVSTAMKKVCEQLIKKLKLK